MASYDIFTPPVVAKKMVSYFTGKVHRLLEPAVGPGNLLNAMEGLYDHADVYDINADYLANVTGNNVTKYHCDFLTADHTGLYDGIVLNPPYQRFQDRDPEYRKTVRVISEVLSEGNLDLYSAFIVKWYTCCYCTVYVAV